MGKRKKYITLAWWNAFSRLERLKESIKSRAQLRPIKFEMYIRQVDI